MLTRIVMMVIIVGSEIDTLVVKVFYLNKFLPEQSSVVGLAEEKFLSNFAEFLSSMIQKQLSRNEKFHGNKAFY